MSTTHTQPTAPTCQKSGFNYDGHTILFVEAKGKDTSFQRWRLCLYYEPNLADTAFFDTEAGYLAFLAEAKKHTFAEYSEFRAWWDAKETPPKSGPTPGAAIEKALTNSAEPVQKGGA